MLSSRKNNLHESEANKASSFFSRFILVNDLKSSIKPNGLVFEDMSVVRTTTTTLLEDNNKMVVNLSSSGGATKRELEKEKSSSVSTDSSSSSGGGNSQAATRGRTPNNSGSSNGSATSSKLSKFGKRLRESCRNLRGKSSTASKYTPEDYTAINGPKDSNRSRHYVAMDFSGKIGRIVEGKDVRGYTSKDGYAYFRRKVSPKDYEHLLTETQKTIHLQHPWFHKGLGRDMAQRILATHNLDGAFLVRDSSVEGGFVISYVFNGRTFHAQVLPEANTDLGHVYYSLDEGKTKFFDLLQVVEFYQLNRGSLNTKLTHLIVREEVVPKEAGAGAACAASAADADAKSESSSVRSDHQSACQMESAKAAEATEDEGEDAKEDEDCNKMDTNHNSHDEKIVKAAVNNKGQATGGANFIEVEAIEAECGSANGFAGEEDAQMASEGDSDSLKERQA